LGVAWLLGLLDAGHPIRVVGHNNDEIILTRNGAGVFTLAAIA